MYSRSQCVYYCAISILVLFARATERFNIVIQVVKVVINILDPEWRNLGFELKLVLLVPGTMEMRREILDGEREAKFYI